MSQVDEEEVPEAPLDVDVDAAVVAEAPPSAKYDTPMARRGERSSVRSSCSR